MNNETATINTAPLVREPVKTAERSCPFHYRKDSGLLLCVNGISLCGVWMYAGDLEQENDGGQDFCPVCRKKLKERRERSGA